MSGHRSLAKGEPDCVATMDSPPQDCRRDSKLTNKNKNLSSKPSKVKISDNGLRYKTKPIGSPFPTSLLIAGSTLSCFFCGQHRTQAQRRLKKILGKNQAVCEPSCRSAKA